MSYIPTKVTRFKHHGFTLVEVLVALAVFSVAAVAASSAASSYINSVDRLRTKTLAHFVAQNSAADLRMSGTWQDGSSSKTVSEQGSNWEVVTKAVATPDANVRRMEITVNAVQGDKKNGVHELVVFVKKPQGSGS